MLAAPKANGSNMFYAVCDPFMLVLSFALRLSGYGGLPREALPSKVSPHLPHIQTRYKHSIFRAEEMVWSVNYLPRQTAGSWFRQLPKPHVRKARHGATYCIPNPDMQRQEGQLAFLAIQAS